MSFLRSLLLLAAAAAILYPSRARPCSPPPCLDPASVAPGTGQSVPANAPAVVLLNNHFFGGAPQDAGIVLFKPDGGEYPVELVFDGFGWIVTPLEPLVAGETSVMHYGRTCEVFNPNVDAGERYEAPIQVAPGSHPLPQDIGALELVETGEQVQPFLNSCGGPAGHYAFARLKVVPSAEMEPWLPLARWTLSIDGAPWARTTYGQSQGVVGFATRTVNHVHAQCPVRVEEGADASVLIGDPGVSHGRHQARLEAHIAGLDASFGPVFLEVPLLCDAGTPPEGGPGPLDGYDQVPVEGCACASGATGLWALLGLLTSVAVARRRGVKVANEQPRT